MQILLNILIDLIYVALAVITIIIFTKRGFIDSAYRFGRTVFASLICYFWGPSVTQFVHEKWMYKGVLGFVSERVEKVLTETANALDIHAMIDSLPFFIRQLINREAMEARYNGVTASIDVIATDFSETVAAPVSSLLSTLIAYTVLFLLSSLALLVVFKLLDQLFKLPGLNAVNKVLGFIFGLLAAYLLLIVVTFVLGLLVGLLGSTSAFKQVIDGSALFRLFNKLSILNVLSI